MFRRKPLEIELPPLHPGQKLVRDSKARFRVVCCGRRWGKSRLASALAVERALLGGVTWIVTPTYSLGEPIYNDVRRLSSQIPDTKLNRVDRRIDYPGGGYVQVKTGDNPSLLRGQALDMAIFDEAAHTEKLEELWVEVIRPALADRRGRALFCSTPAGRNYFWQLWQLGQDEEQGEWRSWQMATGSNPFIAATEILSARRQMTERQFNQEFLAQFAEDGGVFTNFEELATATEQTHSHLSSAYVMGVDWGRSNDATVISVIDTSQMEQCHQLRLVNMGYEQQINRLHEVCQRFHPSVILAEANSMGQPLIERLVAERLPVRPFQTTNASKMAIIDGLVMAFEQQRLRILPDPVLLRELEMYEAETLPSGLVRYSAPHGQHDDCVVALALAYHCIAGANSEYGFQYRYA